MALGKFCASDEHTIASEKKGKRGGKLGALKALIDRAVRALEPYVTERWDEGTFVPAHDLELVWTYTAEKMARFEAADAKKVLIKAKQEASAAKRAGKKIAKPRSIDVSNAHEVKREVVVANRGLLRRLGSFLGTPSTSPSC